MYACTHETGCGFFKAVRALSNATAHSYYPPRALYWNQVRIAKWPNHPWKHAA
jgi:hypothetical protein